MAGIHWRRLDGLTAKLGLCLDEVTHQPGLGEGVSEPAMLNNVAIMIVILQCPFGRISSIVMYKSDEARKY